MRMISLQLNNHRVSAIVVGLHRPNTARNSYASLYKSHTWD